ncbi:MAG: dephospho-CoA kinase [Zoogloeaceae bacterium]|jgi:dephospho-CoA kinase|nr:dephospho-CoA kinase [Zoogloeaceae bacterium]
MSSAPFVVGLTGGVGSGKSTAARFFVELGADLVDTDAIAHRLTGKGGAAMPALMEAFGAEIAAADGSLARPEMRRRIFADPAQKKRLESILHPMIRAEAGKAIAASAAPYLLYAIPLLVESGGRATYALNRVLLVDCPEALQCERAVGRGNLSEEEVWKIIHSQASRAERSKVADDILDNSGDEASLLQAVRILHERYLRLAGEKLRDGG